MPHWVPQGVPQQPQHGTEGGPQPLRQKTGGSKRLLPHHMPQNTPFGHLDVWTSGGEVGGWCPDPSRAPGHLHETHLGHSRRRKPPSNRSRAPPPGRQRGMCRAASDAAGLCRKRGTGRCRNLRYSLRQGGVLFCRRFLWGCCRIFRRSCSIYAATCLAGAVACSLASRAPF